MKNLEDDIFITQEDYAKDVLKKFNTLESKHANTPMECRTKLSKLGGQECVDPIPFKSLTGSLRYFNLYKARYLTYNWAYQSFYRETFRSSHEDGKQNSSVYQGYY